MDWNELHKDALVIDAYNDTIVAHIRRGNLSLIQGREGAPERHSGTIAVLRGHEEPRSEASWIQIARALK